ncbi:MotE family protein [Rhizobiaceae bacterium]|nr:MotE family protein [Rhizobiaceae bacterium]
MIRLALTLALLTGPTHAASSDRSEIERFCGSIQEPARERRYALLKAQIKALERAMRVRAEALDAKRVETEAWLEKRDAFTARAEDTLVDIYSRMRPDAAAERLELVSETLAAAIVMKLKPKDAGLLLNEMSPEKAASISAIISASGRPAT